MPILVASVVSLNSIISVTQNFRFFQFLRYKLDEGPKLRYNEGELGQGRTLCSFQEEQGEHEVCPNILRSKVLLKVYGDRVLEHFRCPCNPGEMPEPDGVGEATNPVCGDRMRLFLKVEGEVIRAATFLAEGCVAAIAAGSMTTLLLTGRTLTEALRISDREVAEALGGLPASKIHCSVLAEDAILEAVEDVRRRRDFGLMFNQERGNQA